MPNDLPKYDSLPPLSPAHKPSANLVDRQDAAWAKMLKPIDTKRVSCCEYLGLTADKIDALSPHKPTPTISQMSDLHERQVFADSAERLINKALAFFLTVLAVLFVGGMIYRRFVWGH
jgi:hypothetical protein